MLKRLFAAGLIATAATLTSLAPVQAQGIADPAKAEGGSFVLDPAHTMIVFSISHMGFTTFYGSFADKSGTLTFDPKAPAKSALEVTVSTASVSTNVEHLNNHLKTPDFLDTEKFPSATFKATKIEVTGPETGKITGDLTLHGVTKPLTLDAKFHGAGVNPLDKKYTVGFDATTVIHRSDYDIKTYVPLVGDDVTLMISAGFERK
jgi:polyisoprenoid-binding protein YceI